MAKSKYKPEYCQKLIDHMSEGDSFESFAVRVDVSRGTLYEWLKVHPDFFNAKEKASERCEKWWVDLGKRHAQDSVAGYTFMMKARFGWKETSAVEHSGPGGAPIETKNLGNMTDEELQQKIDKLLRN
jgi:transposase